MNLSENTVVSDAALPLDGFKAHLRMGTGFADDGAQDSLLLTLLRASMKAIETRTSKALITRTFRWHIYGWRTEASMQAFPMSPVSNIHQFWLVKRDGSKTLLSSDRFKLRLDGQVPKIMPVGGCLPAIESGGWAELVFWAGYGDWNAVPDDLKQAMLMLAASYYEHRDGFADTNRQIPMSVATLIAPYRRIRLGGAA